GRGPLRRRRGRPPGRRGDRRRARRSARDRADRRPARHPRAGGDRRPGRSPTADRRTGGRTMSADDTSLLWQATRETLMMVGVAMAVTIPLGLALGVLLLITGRGQILEQPLLNKLLGAIVNVGRSVPFIILLVAVIPLTRVLVGTT